MRSTELHGERRGWNLHFKGRVVRLGLIFLEVWIFRNVRNRFQNFIAHHVTAAAAKREDGVAHKDNAGPRLVLMAYLVNSGLLDQLSWSQRAIALIKSFNVGVIQFHDGLFCVLPPPAWEQLSPSMGCTQASNKLERSGLDKKFCDFIFRQPELQVSTADPQSCRTSRPREFQI
jgi:hypothetical protein